MSGLRNGEPKPGERVAVLGLGGLGHLALQLSKAVGLETFAITGQADKKAELKGSAPTRCCWPATIPARRCRPREART